MSVRIIAGEKRGLLLKTPAGQDTRPTLSRVRESLFMILQHELAGARVLDVFAGSGALGLEALSRGAAFAGFVENARPAVEALKANIEKMGCAHCTRVHEREALGLLRGGNAGAAPYDLVLLDPPYGAKLADAAMEAATDARLQWTAESGVIALQAGKRDALPEAYGAWRRLRRNEYGETVIGLYEKQTGETRA